MRRRSALAFLGTVAVGYGSALVGCVSNNNAPGGGGDDVSLPAEDSGGTTLVDAGTHAPGDSSAPQDSTLPPDDTGPTGTADTSTPVTSTIRFAWFVGGGAFLSDGGLAAIPYDVCISPHGTGAWQGPLLAASSLPGGLQPFDVTKYFTVAPGQYDARIVAAGSTSCELPDAGSGSPSSDAGDGGNAEDAGSAPGVDFTSLPAVAPETATTVVFVDPRTSSNIADAFVFTDDTTTQTGQGKIRFVNVSETDVVVANADDAGADAAPDDAGTSLVGATFGLGGESVFTPLFTNVTSAAGVAPTGNGYLDTVPLSGINAALLPPASGPVTVEAAPGPRGLHARRHLRVPRPAAAIDLNAQYVTSSLTVPAGGILTAFYAYEVQSSSPALVWCYDGQPSASSSALTQCAYVDSSSQQTATEDGVRFANFLSDADAGAVDVCAKYHTYGTYSGPLFSQQGFPSGIPAESVSGYMSFVGTYDYDVRFVAAGAADCSTSLVDGTFTAHDEPGCGGYSSVLLVGYEDVPDDAGTVPPYDAGPPEDAGPDAGPQPVSSGVSTLAASIVSMEDEACASPTDTDNAAPAIRLVHAAPDTPGPISMTVTDGTTTWALDNVPYGGFSTEPEPVDPWGYETMASAELTLTLGGYSEGYDLGTDQQSMFVVHGPSAVEGPKGPTGGFSAEILVCNDWDEYYFDNASAQCCVIGLSVGACGGEGPTGPTGG